MPGIKVKTAQASADKFKRNAGGATDAYKTGVAAAGPDWQAHTAASETVWAQATQDAIGRGAFGKGVTKAGAGKYTDRATNLGAGRYVSGINAGAGQYQAGIQPYLDVLSNLQLSPRHVKGQNQDRSNAVAQALRAKKLAG
jgi:membrane protein involved in colicin uptake